MRTLAAALALAVLPCGSAFAQSTAYEQNWFRVTSGLMTLAGLTQLDPQKPAPAAVAALKQATDDLEQSASTLSRAVPPAPLAAAHVAFVPRVLMVVGAARDCLHAVEASNSAEVRASLEWVDDTILRARRALSLAGGGKL